MTQVTDNSHQHNVNYNKRLLKTQVPLRLGHLDAQVAESRYKIDQLVQEINQLGDLGPTFHKETYDYLNGELAKEYAALDKHENAKHSYVAKLVDTYGHGNTNKIMDQAEYLRGHNPKYLPYAHYFDDVLFRNPGNNVQEITKPQTVKHVAKKKEEIDYTKTEDVLQLVGKKILGLSKDVSRLSKSGDIGDVVKLAKQIKDLKEVYDSVKDAKKKKRRKKNKVTKVAGRKSKNTALTGQELAYAKEVVLNKKNELYDLASKPLFSAEQSSHFGYAFDYLGTKLQTKVDKNIKSMHKRTEKFVNGWLKKLTSDNIFSNKKAFSSLMKNFDKSVKQFTVKQGKAVNNIAKTFAKFENTAPVANPFFVNYGTTHTVDHKPKPTFETKPNVTASPIELNECQMKKLRKIFCCDKRADKKIQQIKNNPALLDLYLPNQNLFGACS